MLLGTLEEEEEEENHLLQQQQLFVRDNDGNESSRILITVRVFYSKRRQAYYALLAFLRADSRRTVQDFSVATTAYFVEQRQQDHAVSNSAVFSLSSNQTSERCENSCDDIMTLSCVF
jgi:hypothetical protein